MTATLSLAITADLHWGHRRGREATELLAGHLHREPPDLLVLAGDIGTGEHFEACLGLFADLPCRKALVPGNHDLWVQPEAEDDSLVLYEELLPRAAERHGFHYLDHGPLLLPDCGLALVGSVNWYDYSWSLDEIRRLFPGEEHRLASKRFPRGRHNDGHFIRWPLDDGRFTARVVSALEAQLQVALAQAERAIVVTHHPPFYGLGFPRTEPPADLESFLWDAFSGNRAMEEVLTRYADRIAFAFCGHTHRARENRLGALRGYNVGGDYHFKRLLRLDWPAGEVRAQTFGDPAG